MSSCRAVVSVTKTCQRCGVAFPCGMGCCWCGEIPAAPAVVETMRDRYSDCLCPACLQTVADECRIEASAERVPG